MAGRYGSFLFYHFERVSGGQKQLGKGAGAILDKRGIKKKDKKILSAACSDALFVFTAK